MSSEAAALTRVISDIYDAAVDSVVWPRAMQSACEFIGGSQSTMFWQDSAEADVVKLYSYNEDPHYSRTYLQTYAPLNPLFPAAIFQPVGSVTASFDLVPDADMHQTRFYKEWMAPQNITGALAVLVEKDATRAAFLAVQWQGGAIGAESRERMTMLVPHFQRAVAIGRLFVKRRAMEAALTDTLDHIDAGVFLVVADGRLMFVNARGRRMLAEADLVREDAGRLRAVPADADRALSKHLRAIADETEMIGKSGSAIALSKAADGWAAHVLPLIDGARRRAGESHSAVAAVFVRSSSLAGTTPLETLAKLYGLTASEIRVVEAMLRISGLKAIAVALGISRATVKTHLNRVYRKCCARNQSDLIKLIAGLRALPAMSGPSASA